MDFVGFPFRTSKLKNDINYIKYKFSHKFEKVRRWLNMYYSNIRMIIIFKITTMSIWIILKNLVWTCKECNFCWYWTIVACIYPWQNVFQTKEFDKIFLSKLLEFGNSFMNYHIEYQLVFERKSKSFYSLRYITCSSFVSKL
jgi:hypothetical protein